MLVLEVAEDYAILAKNAMTSVQVKETAKSVSITLQSPAAQRALTAFWNFKGANPGKKVDLRFLTTSRVGKEKALRFPEKLPGLEYWRIAARDGSDVEPMREALLRLNLPEPLSDFLKKADSRELRDGLLRRISWECGTADVVVLEQSIRDQLVYLGEKSNLAPRDAERAIDTLLAELLKTITQDTKRKLTRADLLRLFHESTAISLPASVARQALSQAMAGQTGGQPGVLIADTSLLIRAAGIPLPPNAIDRSEVVSRVMSMTGRHGALWLHGSSGLGKTVLVQLVARASSRNWYVVQLRSCSAPEVEYRLRAAAAVVNSRDFGGVILDDFPTEHASSARLRLSILAHEVRRCDGALVVTASKAPSPNLQSSFANGSVCIEAAPYLTEQEVRDLVVAAGGDGPKWARVVHTFCGFGHPQLVDARVRGLQHRGWPDYELTAGLDPLGQPAKEVEDEREAIRSRLLSELPDYARELLYRLTLVVGRFDRRLAIAIGEVAAPVARPGEAFDLLVGPWIETSAADRFSVSPLIGNAGAKTLSPVIQGFVHRKIVEDLIARSPFPADLLAQVFHHALVSRHEAGLAWLSMAIQMVSGEHERSILEQLFILPLLDTYDNQPLFEENHYVSAMLRLAQFKVAGVTGRTDRLERIADRLISEARLVKPKRASKGLLLVAISKVLTERALSMAPKKWMSLLEEAEKILSSDASVGKAMRKTAGGKEKSVDWSPLQLMFVVRATALDGIDHLVELFGQLEKIGAERRNELLAALEMPQVGSRLMVNSAWLAEVRRGPIDGRSAAEKYSVLVGTSQRWGSADLAVECEVARAVMLDEYADDSTAALAVLDNAEKLYPGDVRLVRQRSKVHFRAGDHEAALRLFEPIAAAIPRGDSVERAFALREAGISSANTGDLSKALRFFREASEAAGAASEAMLPMAAGLKADCAVVEFQAGHHESALRFAIDAFRHGDLIDPEAGPKERFCALMLGHMVLWMRSQLRNSDWYEQDTAMSFGACSNSEPPAEIMERKVPPRLLRWYLLAELEADLGLKAGALEELRQRSRGAEIISYEVALSTRLMARIVSDVDLDRFCSYLPEYVAKRAFGKINGQGQEKDDVFNPRVGVIPPVNSNDWSIAPYFDIARDAIIALLASALSLQSRGSWNAVTDHVARIEGVGAALKSLLRCARDRKVDLREPYEMAVVSIGRLAESEGAQSPDELFLATCCLVNWLAYSAFTSTVEIVLADVLVRRWRHAIVAQRFLLRLPSLNAPPIQAALDSAHQGVVKLAGIALAAEGAVHYPLSAEMRDFLKQQAGS